MFSLIAKEVTSISAATMRLHTNWMQLQDGGTVNTTLMTEKIQENPGLIYLSAGITNENIDSSQNLYSVKLRDSSCNNMDVLKSDDSNQRQNHEKW